MAEVLTRPVQVKGYSRVEARCPQVVTLRAYEVYAAVFSPQPALIEGDCRGGFSVGELIAFLYARTFPREEWRQRAEEALRGMRNV